MHATWMILSRIVNEEPFSRASRSETGRKLDEVKLVLLFVQLGIPLITTASDSARKVMSRRKQITNSITRSSAYGLRHLGARDRVIHLGVFVCTLH